MRILLVQLPPWTVFSPPIGLAYLLGALKQEGHEISVYDLNILLYRGCQERAALWDDKNKVRFNLLETDKALIDTHISKFLSFQPDIIGFSATAASLEILNYCIHEVKSQNPIIKIIIGGSISSDKQDWSKIQGAAYLTINEAERSIRFILDAFSSGKDLIPRDGVNVFADKSNPSLICVEPESKPMPSDIVSPVFNLFPLDLYTSESISISFSRGCVRRCTFCEDSPYLSPFRTRNPDVAAGEIEDIMKSTRIRIFQVNDLLINGSIPFLDKFCDRIIAKRLHPFWSGQAIIRKEMTADLLKKMRIAGCTFLIYGIESFSEKIRLRMRKGSGSKIAEKVLMDTKRVGIRVGINLMVGFPGEKEGDIEDTIRSLRKLVMYIDQVNSLNLCNIREHTLLYDEYKKYGLKSKVMGLDFDDGTTLKERIGRLKRVYKVCRELGSTSSEGRSRRSSCKSGSQSQKALLHYR
ncbi:MAG: radical SAM protein, partial [Nanoarchaeota archaeon]|nr:radical SAM protein [Nanoarchaeota archaeon]